MCTRPTFFSRCVFLTCFPSVRNKRYLHSLLTLRAKSLHKTCLQNQQTYPFLVDTFYANTHMKLQECEKRLFLTQEKRVKNAPCKKVGRVAVQFNFILSHNPTEHFISFEPQYPSFHFQQNKSHRLTDFEDLNV